MMIWSFFPLLTTQVIRHRSAAEYATDPNRGQKYWQHASKAGTQFCSSAISG